MDDNESKLTIGIVGASGFVGRYLADKWKDQYKVIGFSRTHRSSQQHGIEWRQADFLNMGTTIRALKDVDVAVFLIHSMMPSFTIALGDFQDFDLLAVHNFVEACKYHKVRQLLYLGGIIPEGVPLSPHLQSRLEVEETLRKGQIPLSAFRAGIVLGQESSSYFLMRKLVLKSPVIFCSSWMLSESRPIFIKDVVEIFDKAILNEEAYDKVIDLGGPDSFTYKELLQHIAQHLKKSPWFINVPFLWAKPSSWSIQLLTKAPHELVYPLVQSLKYHMIPRHNKYFYDDIELVPIDKALDELDKLPENQPHSFTVARHHKKIKALQAVQRLRMSPGKTVEWSGHEYFHSMGHIPFLPLRVYSQNPKHYVFKILVLPFVLLAFEQEECKECTVPCVRFKIIKGILKHPKSMGILEFIEIEKGKLAMNVIRGFIPRLPASLYKISQAVLHRLAMYYFNKYLEEY